MEVSIIFYYSRDVFNIRWKKYWQKYWECYENGMPSVFLDFFGMDE